MSDFILNKWNVILNILHSISPIDFLDIFLLTILVYTIFKFIRETRAGQLMKGIAFIIIVFFVSDFLKLKAIRWISVLSSRAASFWRG